MRIKHVERRIFHTMEIYMNTRFNSVYWVSPLGETIRFEVCEYYGLWREAGGIYAFCAFDGVRVYTPLYIGKASNLRQRMSSHEKWPSAYKLGACHVLAFAEQSDSKRSFLEYMLIRQFNPPLNTQLKTLPSVETRQKTTPASTQQGGGLGQLASMLQVWW